MIEFAAVLFWILTGMAVGQALLVLLFVRALCRRRQSAGRDPSRLKTAVILCLRGPDPFLPDCLRALVKQDYPDYEVHVIVDSREDPAWQIVESVVQEEGAANVRMEPLANPRDTCSLKCSSLAQAVSGLDQSYDVVALVDADTVPHPTWLSELVSPLADERFGVATGNRWYMPARKSWGALVRYLWNAAAVVQMYCYKIPWGGTLALKTSIFRQSNLLDRWQSAYCEDTMLYQATKQQGLKVAFVPSLMMVNREATDIPDVFRWVRRQLLAARLYHPRWTGVVAHATYAV